MSVRRLDTVGASSKSLEHHERCGAGTQETLAADIGADRMGPGAVELDPGESLGKLMMRASRFLVEADHTTSAPPQLWPTLLRQVSSMNSGPLCGIIHCARGPCGFSQLDLLDSTGTCRHSKLTA